MLPDFVVISVSCQIEALIAYFKIDELKDALLSLEEFQDMTISDVTSFSRYNNSTAFYRGVAYNVGCFGCQTTLQLQPWLFAVLTQVLPLGLL